ncbi:hypothetical protein Pka01_69240 [Planotetraspora kaengkrachanensis]|uniref:Uncharacterized protein n=1 Tax=Planotetraspora kaengkrachanensis TaxID=575193 RepID=A0A8J3PZB8_9ACTN|nr:hypothetical protein Pka01_69240 [Planotetraspora kaengkrachanensis]
MLFDRSLAVTSVMSLSELALTSMGVLHPGAVAFAYRIATVPAEAGWAMAISMAASVTLRRRANAVRP